MTNLVAGIIVVLIQTNWVHTGQFTALDGSSFRVEEGRIRTNTMLHVQFEGQLREFTLKQEDGSLVGERKILLGNPLLPRRVAPVPPPLPTNAPAIK